MNNWIEKEQPKKDTIQSLKKDLKIDDFLCSLLLQREVDSLKKAQNFFRPDINLLHDPFLMKDMKKVIKKIENSKEERIMILGDYDVDGTTSTAMLYKYFKDIDYDIIYYIPDRYSEGYGVSEKAIEYAEKNRVSLIITVDCGIKAINQVDISNSKNIEMIICDHHLPGDQIPNAFGILNPKQENCKYPFKDLCGCGIAYKLITAHNSLSENSIDISIFLDFVALATVSDMMPLIDENRMSYQLNALSKFYVGIGKDEKILLEAAKEYGLDAKADMWRLPPMFVGQYAERDAEATLKLWQRLKVELYNQELMDIFNLEIKLFPCLVDMRFRKNFFHFR